MLNNRLCVIGGGQMGRALVGGILAREVIAANRIAVVEPDVESQAWWSATQPEVSVHRDLPQALSNADTVLLAVKPKIVPQVAQQTEPGWTDRLVISIAAGVKLHQLTDWIGHRRVVRVMPNTPCLVGAGASAYCVAADVGKPDLKLIGTLLGAVGLAVQVDEAQMDAVTGLSGSGPAYVFVAIEALADGAVAAGLPRSLALQLAAQTLLGAARMVLDSGRHPAELKDAVASPGGTTIAGLRALEQNGFRAALIEAVAASAARSESLGTQ